MSALAHHLKAPSAKIWPMSVQAYHALGELGLIPERTELLYGAVYHKMPKSPFQSFLGQRLLHLLQQVVPDGFLIRVEQPVICGDSEPEPDLAVIRGPEENFRNAHPSTAELVLEVCVTSHEYDREKLHAFARAGIRECWLVLGPEREIHIYRRPEGGQYREELRLKEGQTSASASVPEITVDLAALFRS